MPTTFKPDADGTLSPETRKAIAKQILEDIEAYSIKTLTDDHRTHLGASIIGKECSREAWYIFRWVKFAAFDGRMLRLFDRGKKEKLILLIYCELSAVKCGK